MPSMCRPAGRGHVVHGHGRRRRIQLSRRKTAKSAAFPISDFSRPLQSTFHGMAAYLATSTVSNLKTRYYKYLETLCAANGVDISSLKTRGSEYEMLEMFFGGFPALIGLKYFERLRVLKLVGQDIVNLKPLTEVAGVLEELWVCEGPIKDVTGIENCKKLRKVYLYDNQIEDGTPLGKLPQLETLWIMNNNLKSLEFLDSLEQLSMLYVGGSQFNDTTALNVQAWPHKLQELDISGNNVKCFQSLLPIANCGVMRCLNVAGDEAISSGLIRSECHFSWLAFHFPFIERLNSDIVSEKFQHHFSYTAENWLFDAYVNLLNAEKAYRHKATNIDKNLHKIQEKLNSLVVTLGKLAATVPKKEGRRDLVYRIQEQSQKSIKSLKRLKRQCLALEYTVHRLNDFYFPTWRLEGGLPSNWPRQLSEFELRLLQHSFQWFGSKTTEHDIRIHAAFAFDQRFVDETNQLTRNDVEKLFFFDYSRQSVLWDLRSAVRLCDKRFTADYRDDTIRIFKDIALFTNEAGDNECFYILPMVKCEKFGRRFRFATKTVEGFDDELLSTARLDSYRPGEMPPEPIITSSRDAGGEFGVATSYVELVHWTDVEFSLLCLVEVHTTSQITFEDIRSPASFDEKFAAQIRKLKSFGIEVKLEKPQSQTLSAEPLEKQISDLTEASGDGGDVISGDAPKKTNVRKVEDFINAELGLDRWRRQQPATSAKRLTLRDPLELALTFSKLPVFVDTLDLTTTVTCLDLSDLKINKLHGIETMTSLVALRLARNKIGSVKKLKQLRNLQVLDLSSNIVTHFDDPPEMLVELNLANNQLTGLAFCARLQLLVSLNVSFNKIKVLKGVENCKLLETFRAPDNQVKEKVDLDALTFLVKLAVVDLSNNPIAETDDFRSRVLQKCPVLRLLNSEVVPKEEKSLAMRKKGKALTLDFIERHAGAIDTRTSLQLARNNFQTVALDRTALLRLQHLTELDLSYNLLEGLNELVELENLQRLNLSHNSVITLLPPTLLPDNNGPPKVKILPNLVQLDLSYNSLNNQSLTRLKLQYLVSLQMLDLSGNQLSKFEMAAFDLKSLTHLDLHDNEIRQVRKKPLLSLSWLNLAGNKLKDIDGLGAPNLAYLDIQNNRIVTCSALKPVVNMQSLRELKVAGNAVVERRVYYDFILNHVRSLDFLDGEPLQRLSAGQQQPRRVSRHILDASDAPSQFMENGLMIRKTPQPTKWQSSPSLASQDGKDDGGGPGERRRPLYCPPSGDKHGIIVGTRIAPTSQFLLFPQDHYIAPERPIPSLEEVVRHRREPSPLPSLSLPPARLRAPPRAQHRPPLVPSTRKNISPQLSKSRYEAGLFVNGQQLQCRAFE